MKKTLFLVILCASLSTNALFAQETAQNDTDLLEQLKQNRSSIYRQLNLSPEQIKKINNIDKQRYAELEPKLEKLTIEQKKLKSLADSGNCTMEEVNAIKSEFDNTEKEISPIQSKYEKDLKNVLSTKQKFQYYRIKRTKRAEMRKEIKKLQEEYKK